MESEQMRSKFINVLKENFPEVQYRAKRLASGRTRISPYLPNKKRNKRWMQLDSNKEYLSIAMDHVVGQITADVIKKLNIPYGLDGNRTGIQLQPNGDAVNLSIFINDEVNFNQTEFIQFLHKHYVSYSKLVNF
ncbi:hypothetical protein V7139_22180 [Neobacillus drentensis]|uniref:hypothetical protein n=1 Tax=Neobacillus drentensis TaxID=220684 RepID=UPI003002ECD2